MTKILITGASGMVGKHLVDMCLELEDFAVELGFEFDWASEKAMSATNSIFKDAGSLSKEFIRQWKEN